MENRSNDVYDDLNDINLDSLFNTNFEIDYRHGQPLTSEDIQNAVTNQIPAKTRNNAKWSKNTFNSWVKERNTRILDTHTNDLLLLSEDGPASLETMSKETLNYALKFFFFETRKINGDRYPSDSLRSLFNGIAFYTKNILNKSWQLWTDPEFSDARRALDTAMKQTAEDGINPQRKRAAPIDEEQEKKLWDRKYLGCKNPKTLNRTVLYLLSVNCGLRGGRELRTLTIGPRGSLALKSVDGVRVLEYTESYSKTYKYGLRDHNVEPKVVTVWPADNPDHCPVKLFEKLVSRRPSPCSTDALFLQPVANYTESKWYLNTPIGHNTLDSTIKNLMEAAGEDDENFTNQSGRRTAVTRIMDKTGDKELAKKVSGHRSDCVIAYNHVSRKRLKLASNILTGSVHHEENASISMSSLSTQNITTGSERSLMMDIAEACRIMEAKPLKISITQSDGSTASIEF
jgi:hypothetical protein